MTFQDSVKTCFAKYATFSGRATRSEYWYFVLLYFIVNIVGVAIGLITNISIIANLVSLALIVPYLAVSVRRLHDIGKAGIMFLVALIPLVGAFIFLYWCVQPSVEDNQYGPKQA